MLSKSLTKYGIVKYDAFDDVGGKLSFAIALLDKIIPLFFNSSTSLLSLYGFFLSSCSIVKGESYILLSSEEMDALRQAVHFGENKVR